MTTLVRIWLSPVRPAFPDVVTDRRSRRGLTVELVVVFSITLGLSGARSLLSLVDSFLRPEPLSQQSVALNVPQATNSLIDMFKQLLGVVELVGWGALGAYLLWRGGIALARVGLDRRSPVRDVLVGAGLALLIGVPGLVLYLIGWKLGFNLTVRPSVLGDTWWRPMTLTLAAFGNAFAEEVLVVGYLLTRLRQLGKSENAALVGAAVLRGSYHLYQGIGGFVGNFIMGLIFGRFWQRTNRLWSLVVAHTLLDVVAFVGYSLLHGRVDWLP